MNTKQISAVVMVLGAVLISGWVAVDMGNGGVPASPSDAAWKMLWAIGYVIVFNIIAVIIGAIVVAIFQRGEPPIDQTDERDRLINSRSMVTGYFVLSIGVLGVLIVQALGLPANLVPYALFGISMLAGASFAAAQLVLYRVS